jgi:hypothetical protein
MRRESGTVIKYPDSFFNVYILNLSYYNKRCELTRNEIQAFWAVNLYLVSRKLINKKSDRKKQ